MKTEFVWLKVWHTNRGTKNTEQYIIVEKCDDEESYRYDLEEWLGADLYTREYIKYGFEVVKSENVPDDIKSKISNDMRYEVSRLKEKQKFATA